LRREIALTRISAEIAAQWASVATATAASPSVKIILRAPKTVNKHGIRTPVLG
jgi:hypothetical protein